MKVFLAGATGAIGKRLVPLLVSAGHKVTGTTRHPGKAESIRSAGATPVVVNAFSAREVLEAVQRAEPDVIIHQLTAIPASFNLRRFDEEFALTNRLRSEGTDHLLAAARAVGCRRFIAQSYAGWPYARTGAWIKVEEDPLLTSPEPQMRQTFQAILHVEHAVLEERSFEGFVLRYGSFYGPGTSLGQGGSFLEDIQKRSVPIVGKGTGYWSFLQWLPFLAETLGAKVPRHIPTWLGRLAVGPQGVAMMTQIRGASNQKAKSLLGWKPEWLSWRKGFRDGLEDKIQKTSSQPRLAKAG